jgi:glycosyltransferase involved in cell wall biosynthesis
MKVFNDEDNKEDLNDIVLSIIGPAMNEAGNLVEYVDRCIRGFELSNVSGEIIIINDGSTDDTRDVLQKLINKYPKIVRGFNHRKNLGLTQALRTGFSNSKGQYIIWLSSDLESHPDEDIPIFMEGFIEGADVVAGARIGRADGKDFASSIYNKFCQKIFGLELRDMNWMKGFHRKCLPFLELRGDWHRFILVMLHTAGFKIIEKEMQWYSRTYGKSKFGLMRFPQSMVDAISVWLMMTFSRKPMRIFGIIGGISGFIGVSLHVWLTFLYLSEGTQVRPLFWAALVLEIFAIQMIMFGFIAELIERIRDDVNNLHQRFEGGQKLEIEIKAKNSINNKIP